MFAKSVLSFGTMAGSIELGNLTWTEWWPCPFQIYPRASDVFLPKIMKLASKKAQKMGQKIVKLLNNPWSWNLLSTYPLIEWPPTYFFTIYIILYLAGKKARKKKAFLNLLCCRVYLEKTRMNISFIKIHFSLR